MLHDNLIDRIISDAQAGVSTDETRFTREFVANHLSSARAEAIRNFWLKYRSVNPLWLQEVVFDYNVDLQEDVNSACITKFRMPRFISLDGKSNGFMFAGNRINESFRVFNSRASFSNSLKRSNGSPYSGRFVAVLVEGDSVEFHYNQKIKSPKALILYGNPLDCVSYRVDYDPYPVTEDLIGVMEEYLWKKFLSMASQPIDGVSDKKDTKVLQQQPTRQ